MHCTQAFDVCRSVECGLLFPRHTWSSTEISSCHADIGVRQGLANTVDSDHCYLTLRHVSDWGVPDEPVDFPEASPWSLAVVSFISRLSRRGSEKVFQRAPWNTCCRMIILHLASHLMRVLFPCTVFHSHGEALTLWSPRTLRGEIICW